VKPLSQYNTKFVWSGLRRFDTHTKKAATFFDDDGAMLVKPVPYTTQLSRIDYVEEMEVRIYSMSPHVWSEGNDLFEEDVPPASTPFDGLLATVKDTSSK